MSMLFSGINIDKFVIFNLENGFSLRSIICKKPKFTKLNSHIVFIDDEQFPIVDNLRKAGWNVKRLRDLTNIQDEEIVKAQIIFVDFKGVGNVLAEKDQGLGLIELLKKEYDKSKRVILCSGIGFKLDKRIDVADCKIFKGSDTHQFITLIEEELAKL